MGLLTLLPSSLIASLRASLLLVPKIAHPVSLLLDMDEQIPESIARIHVSYRHPRVKELAHMAVRISYARKTSAVDPKVEPLKVIFTSQKTRTMPKHSARQSS